MKIPAAKAIVESPTWADTTWGLWSKYKKFVGRAVWAVAGTVYKTSFISKSDLDKTFDNCPINLLQPERSKEINRRMLSSYNFRTVTVMAGSEPRFIIDNKTIRSPSPPEGEKTRLLKEYLLLDGGGNRVLTRSRIDTQHGFLDSAEEGTCAIDLHLHS